MDWSRVDWAVVTATLLGPIFAVLITLWHQKRERISRSRVDLFAAMMRSRRHPLSADFVQSLNLVPIHFYSKRQVMEKYSDLMKVYDDNGWRSDRETVIKLNDSCNTAIAYLLHSMGQSLGVNIEQIQILKGGYAPQGWADEEELTRRLRLSLLQMLDGTKPLPVAVTHAETDPKQ